MIFASEKFLIFLDNVKELIPNVNSDYMVFERKCINDK